MNSDLEAAVKLVHNRPRISFNVSSGCIRVWCSGRQSPQEYFYRGQHGSWLGAVRAAIKFEEGLDDYTRAGLHRPKIGDNPNSMSGIYGITAYTRLPDRTEIRGWIASWSEPDPYRPEEFRRKSKSFAYSVYGPHAKEIAEAYREDMLREHHPYMFEV